MFGQNPIFGQPANQTPQNNQGTNQPSLFGTLSTTSLFGQPAAPAPATSTATAQAASSTLQAFSFGPSSTFGQSSIFGQPANQTPQASQGINQPSLFGTPSTTSLFGQPAAPATATSAAPAPTASSTFSFGPTSTFGQSSIFGQPATQTPQANQSTTQPSLFGTPSTTSLFGQTAVPAPAATSTPAAISTPTQPTSQAQQAPQITQPSLFGTPSGTPLFGQPAAPAPATSSAPTVTSTPTQPASQALQAPQTTQSVAQPSSSPAKPPGMTFKQLEDNVNAWLTELDLLERDFRKQAEEINTWDALLMKNSVRILEIDQKVEELKVENAKLDRALDFIVEQQHEIEKLLEPIENIKITTIPNGEREMTYNLVETIQNELHSLSEDLQCLVTKLNDLRSSDNNLDPITQIERVLNAQIDSLQFIEHSVSKNA